MQIAIVNKSELNNCWSALQYTNNCLLCDKILTCKVSSNYHKDGLTNKLEYEKNRIISEHQERLTKLEKDVNNTLKVITKQS